MTLVELADRLTDGHIVLNRSVKRHCATVLVVSGPIGSLTPDLREAVGEFKAALLQKIAEADHIAYNRCEWCNAVDDSVRDCPELFVRICQYCWVASKAP